MSRSVLVISPSGNFYGSEQVLCDYLAATEGIFEIAVPEGSQLQEKLKNSRHRVTGFKGVKLFYIRLIFRLIKGDFSTVYVNEGGHSRYIQVLSRMFPRVKFVVHIRIMEDTDPSRWRYFRPNNTQLVAISEYLQKRLTVQAVLINDLFPFPESMPSTRSVVRQPLQIAVIGRLSYTKGFKELAAFVNAIESTGQHNSMQVNVYGDVMKDVYADPSFAMIKNMQFVRLHGFVPGEQIYADNDLVLHLSKVEPLGRIFFESIAHGLPFVGFNSGGIGEIAANVGLQSFLVDPGPDEAIKLADKVMVVSAGSNQQDMMMAEAFERMKNLYSPEVYTSAMDSILLQEVCI